MQLGHYHDTFPASCVDDQQAVYNGYAEHLLVWRQAKG
jgi:hypothetical protein